MGCKCGRRRRRTSTRCSGGSGTLALQCGDISGGGEGEGTRGGLERVRDFACLSACLPACLPACLTIEGWLCLPACLPT